MGQNPGALVNTQIAGYLIWELPKYGILGFDSSSLHIPTHEIGKASDPLTNHAPPIHQLMKYTFLGHLAVIWFETKFLLTNWPYTFWEKRVWIRAV